MSQLNALGKSLLITFALAATLMSCFEPVFVFPNLGDWARKAELDGNPRGQATGFVVNGKGYLTTGIDKDNNYLRDVWEYDPVANIWNGKSIGANGIPFPGVGRTGAVAFSIGNFGYVSTGVDNNGTRLADFYQYNPATNTWKKIADFPGTARRDAVGFAIGNLGYVATGFDGNQQKDAYSYDPATNTWTKIASFGGVARSGAATFVIGTKAYVGCGNNNGVDQNDFWEFDQTTGVWTERTNFTDTALKRSYGVGFAINGKGYFAGSNANIKSVYEYYPGMDTWTARADFGGVTRGYAVGWSIGNQGYLLTGSNGPFLYDDIWSFTPSM